MSGNFHTVESLIVIVPFIKRMPTKTKLQELFEEVFVC